MCHDARDDRQIGGGRSTNKSRQNCQHEKSQASLCLCYASEGQQTDSLCRDGIRVQ